MKEIRELDSLRGFMALWVYISHILFISGKHDGRILGLMANGQHPVTVFIMLSGFAITTSLMRSPVPYWDYMGKRFFRIYPIYAIALVLGISTSHLYPDLLNSLNWANPGDISRIAARTEGEQTSFVAHLLAHITMFHGLVPDRLLYGAALTFNGALWSLSLEWQFYLVAPFIVAAFARPDRNWVWVGLIAAIAFIGPKLFVHEFSQIPSFLPQRLSFFIVGILTALHFENLTKNPGLAVAGAAVLFVLTYEPIPVAIWCFFVLAAAWPNNPVLGFFGRIFRHPVFVEPGRRSYGFYAIHMPILIAWAVFLQQQGLAESKLIYGLALCLCLPVTLAVAWFSFDYFEWPINNWAKRFFRARQTRHATPSPAE
ncbi:acyltransferase family protein [Rhizobium esperanzae]|uniref:Peptidoglycan/LPS O-acetylase OafA/YrhL n=1 Tax=Rhizobium esperanzae TaxID=1967781 RepID=A0A7W6W499_9HYPH|nr:acyltransferase [Rhizobium esperanzae]MBB4235106.1 peptidoglycan/LPS O-acetylase OafA/YrhL [Rhizobium esperanzae]